MFKPKLFHRADLFDQSTMSFGAHLEELRAAIVKACLWLAIGTAIGVYFAADVIKYVSQPFQDELRNLQVRKVADAYRAVNKQEPSSQLKAWMAKQGMIPEQVFVVPSADASQLTLDAFFEGTRTDRLMRTHQ